MNLKIIFQVQKAELEANLISIASFMTARVNREMLPQKRKEKSEKKIILHGTRPSTINIDGSAGKYCTSLSPERTNS